MVDSQTDVLTFGELTFTRIIKPFPVLNVRYKLESKYYITLSNSDPLQVKTLNKHITIHLAKKNGKPNLNQNHVYMLLKYYDKIIASHW